MFASLRLAVAAAGVSLALLSGCASAPAQHAATGCYWPGPMYQDCSEIIEFNSWR